MSFRPGVLAYRSEGAAGSHPTSLCLSSPIPDFFWNYVRTSVDGRLHGVHVGCLGSLMKSGASLMAHFFFVLNNIPLSGCSTIYISIYLLKSQAYLLSFQALPIRNKGDIRICQRVLVRTCVSSSQGPASQLGAPRPGSHGPTAAPSGKPASPQQPCWAGAHWAFSDSTRQLLSALDPSIIHFSRVF